MNINRIKRILSLLLAVIMLAGAMPAVIFADETDDIQQTADGAENTDTQEEGEEEGEEESAESSLSAYLKTRYEKAEDKLNNGSFKLMLDQYGYELWCDEVTGEIALVNKTTHKILFSNPYFPTGSTDDVNRKLLSQIILSYSATTTNAEDKEMNSFADAAEKGQIKVKTTKTGLRVEYAIGEEESRYLVPMMIEKSSFEEKIFNNLTEYQQRKFKAYYTLMDPYAKLSEDALIKMRKLYPITEQMAVYIFDTTASAREKKEIEDIIKLKCPKYTYAILEEDHQLTNYVSVEKAPPLFRMALEYQLDEQGLSVRLPANGIRYDEDTYALNYISILPYFGAGSNQYEGYTFVPDGSGALFDFTQLEQTREKVEKETKIYGTDYTKHSIGIVKQETMRLPVFGVVEEYNYKKEVTPEADVEGDGTEVVTDEEVPEADAPEADVPEADAPEADAPEADAPEADAPEADAPEADAPEADAPEADAEIVYDEEAYDRGFFAIIEEGDAMSSIVTHYGGNEHGYNSAFVRFYPRTTDEYKLSATMASGDNDKWEIAAKRKYTGDFRMRLFMLTDNEVAAEAGVEEYYEASYVGMAKAYQDYLVNEGVLTAKEETDKDIPLYIESFGTIDTDSTFLSIPITVTKPLTTFEDLKVMHKELSQKKVNNVNFRLTGFTNGGMISTVATKAEFQDEVGGDEAYADFVKYAKESGITVYPDFDLAYAGKDGWFDDYSASSDAAKTIDNRYMQKRLYYSSFQQTISTGLVCISPAVFGNFYDKVTADIKELGVSGISLSTMGSDLNSDFDKDDTYTREDSKALVQKLLEKASNDYDSVMVEAGNSYTWKYVDTILNVNLDSSRYTNANRSIPFIGMVIHGYIDFAGSPTNMASDIDFEILKMIENGALPYFTLSYSEDNTPLLKEDEQLSQYYSVRYEIWKDDLVEIYQELNGVMKDLQAETIVDHDFIAALRVADSAELAAYEAAVAEIAVPAEGASDEEIEAYEAQLQAAQTEYANKRLVDDGTIVRVEYSDGTVFYLNYNRFDVEIADEATGEMITVAEMSYIKI